jgi:hypothetical protein
MAEERIRNYQLESEYGHSEGNTPENVFRFGATILIIVGADGKIADEEWKAFNELGRRAGATPELFSKMEKFDWKNAKLNDYLPVGMTAGWKNIVLYEAIRVASADKDFDTAERAKVQQAAKALGVDVATVTALEGLAAADAALKRARIQLFTL